MKKISIEKEARRARREVGRDGERRQRTDDRGQYFGFRIADLGYEMWDVGRHRI